MFTRKPLTKNRLFIYHMLRRARLSHSPLSINYLWDAHDVLERLERLSQENGKVGLTALVIKATGDLLGEHPRLNTRLFRGLSRLPLVSYRHVSCSTVVARKDSTGEEILLPLVIRNVNQLSVRQIQEQLTYYKTASLENLEQQTGVAKSKNLPDWLMYWIHRRFRSDPVFTEKQIGSTYAVSALVHRNSGAVAGHTPVIQTSFFPGNIEERVVPYRGEPAIRKMLTFTIVVDHCVVDGSDIYQAGFSLQEKLLSVDYLMAKVDSP